MRQHRLVSGSTLGRLYKCVGSAALPGYGHDGEESAIGIAKHAALALRATMPVDEANEEFYNLARGLGVEEKACSIAESELRAFTWVPPKGCLVEQALALLEDGSVVAVSGGHGSYDSAPEPAILAGQIDVMWSEPEPICKVDGEWRVPAGSVLYVADFKTGVEANVEPVERNQQILGYCLLAARWLKADRAMPVVIFTKRGLGDWDVAQAPLGAAALDRIEARYRNKLVELADARAKFARGEPLPLVEGPQCTFCPAQSHCPANTAAIMKMLDEVDSYGDLPIPASRIGDMLQMKRRLAGAVAKIDRVAKAIIAVDGPIQLGEALAWGKVPTTKDEIDPKIALPMLQEELGEHADEALSISKAAIERGVAALHEATGVRRKKSPELSRIIGRLRKGGAITTVDTFEHTTFRTDLASSPKPGDGMPQALAIPDAEIEV